MSLPNTPLSYLDCFEVFDRALKDAEGVMVRMKSKDAATHFRMRMHQARRVDRQRNCQTYEMEHPLFNSSAYDPLYITIEDREDVYYLFIRHRPVPQEIIPIAGNAPLSIDDQTDGHDIHAEPVDELVDAEVMETPLQITSIRRI